MRSLKSIVEQHDNKQDLRFIGLRPIRSADKDALADFLLGLSDRSRLLRFLTVKNRFSKRELGYLSEVDQQKHVAWVAIDLSAGNERIVGEARFVQLAEAPGTAEFGLAVADALHGNGLGGMLMRVLAGEAARLGVTTLRGFVRRDNAAMLGYLDHRAATKRPDHRDVLRIDLPVAAILGQTVAA